MTKQHPITPPPELVDKLFMLDTSEEGRLIAAYRAGADQELEACCKWLFESAYPHKVASVYLRTTRRPKPPSLKEQALLVIDTAVNDYRMSSDAASIIRRALEALPND